MARKSVKHANQLIDRMFRAVIENDREIFNALGLDLLAEYSDEDDWPEALERMQRPVLVRYASVLKLFAETRAEGPRG